MASLSIENVRKHFGATPILHGVSIQIPDGAFVILVGPSGCGKSTLLRMIAGLEEITAGEIRIGSRVVNGVAPKERDIAMVFQSYALYPHMTVEQNMAFSLQLKARRRGRRCKPRSGAPPTSSACRTCSRAIPRNCRAVSVSVSRWGEPSCAILRSFSSTSRSPISTPSLRVQMRGEIKSLHQRLGDHDVYVTHDQIEAMTMADQIVVMNHGRIEQIGAPLELYDRPANLFVAGFIGSPAMNFIARNPSRRRLRDRGRLDPAGRRQCDGAFRKRGGLRNPARASCPGRRRPAVRRRTRRAHRIGNPSAGQARQPAVRGRVP